MSTKVRGCLLLCYHFKFAYLYVYMSITGFYARKAFPTIAYLYVYKLSSALRLT